MFNLKINHMGVNVKCSVCGKEEVVCESRSKNYKTCSRDCLSIMIKSKNVLNCECTNCGKKFHLKESAVKRYNRNIGTFCSMKCCTEYKKLYYIGINNPNYRGSQYDSDGYRINHYPKIGREKEHRYITMKYLNMERIPKNLIVHHRDCNIYNNVPENLAVLNGSDHRWLHKQFGNATLWAYCQNKIDLDSLISWSNNPQKAKKLLTLNLINQSGVFKQGELLENPTTTIVNEDNQQPSFSSNVIEGSTTNGRILSNKFEDSNADTSALPFDGNIIC